MERRPRKIARRPAKITGSSKKSMTFQEIIQHIKCGRSVNSAAHLRQGMLYFGNYESWRVSITAWLDIIGTNDEKRVLDVLEASVCRTVLRTIPGRHRVDVKTFWEQLKTYSKPFPFFNLPLEIREHVYSHLKFNNLRFHPDVDQRPLRNSSSALSLLRSSLRLSREILPSIWEQLHVISGHYYFRALEAVASTPHLQDNIKYLSEYTLTLRADLESSESPAYGIHLKLDWGKCLEYSIQYYTVSDFDDELIWGTATNLRIMTLKELGNFGDAFTTAVVLHGLDKPERVPRGATLIRFVADLVFASDLLDLTA